MSSLHKRNAKSTINDKTKEKTSVLKKVQFAVGDVIFSRKNRVQNVQRIEQMNLWPYILAFVIFFIFSVYFVDYINEVNDDIIATHQEEYTRLFIPVPCSKDYGTKFKSCLPKKCGRVIRDTLFAKNELEYLKSLAERLMSLGGGSGGATILDLHSGALSFKDKFVNLYQLNKSALKENDFKIYTQVKNKILEIIATEFDVSKEKLYLTKPTFFSRMNNKSAVTRHDEYWHPHIDRVTYGTFVYTSLLYLSEYGVDFTGGRFMFVDKHCNRSVEPTFGRLSFFTSGSENKHFVEKVESGTRYAITVSFTCDKRHGIKDPSLPS